MTSNSYKPPQANATLRSTSGAGFDFEDRISAWLLVKAMCGEQVPCIGGSTIQLQAQVEALGWRMDDILVTSKIDRTNQAHLAISAKGNRQVSRSGLPTDFVERAWEQWASCDGPFNPKFDGLALITRGLDHNFDPHWWEVKNACSGSDIALALARIKNNSNQLRIFNSVQNPAGKAAGDEHETVRLISCLHVIPLDFQLNHSNAEEQSIAQCRRLLESSEVSQAEKLWENLVNIARDVRINRGTVTLRSLFASLRGSFRLRDHPDYEQDWQTLHNVTEDHRSRIETELSTGFSVRRVEESERLYDAVTEAEVTVIFGDSGCGKSALAKTVLDERLSSWKQIWLPPDDLKTALSAAKRNSLPLHHELSEILRTSVHEKSVLILDSSERIEPSELPVLRQLIQALVSDRSVDGSSSWHVLIITQPQNLSTIGETLAGQRTTEAIEIPKLKTEEVRSALTSSTNFSWLLGHDDTIAALTNLRALSWVLKAGAAFATNKEEIFSHVEVADRLWRYWTGDNANCQALMMRLSERDALFERSFALTELNPIDVSIFAERSPDLPLHLNERTNRIVFEHDLAADWSRFQFLKQHAAATEKWVSLAQNPLWTNALRMFGQYLLRANNQDAAMWDVAFAATEVAENGQAGDTLLDALCLDPLAEHYLTERIDFLLENKAKRLEKLLSRFFHIATRPKLGNLGLASSVGLYMEAQFRTVIFSRWPPVLRFLIANREKLDGLISTALSKVIKTWLTETPQQFTSGQSIPFRQEITDMALAMARTVQVEKGQGTIFLDRDTIYYTAPLAGAADLPGKINDWALELAGRCETDPQTSIRITYARQLNHKKHLERLETDPEYKARQESHSKSLPVIGISEKHRDPWPLGPRHKLDMDFRTACFKDNGIVPLMHSSPAVAAEVLLALMIEEEPKQRHRSYRHRDYLGLEFARDGYPTAFWKSPFFSFLNISPRIALQALINLVNFCTDRWFDEFSENEKDAFPCVRLKFDDGSERWFSGWWQIYGWPQTNNTSNGNLFCSLDALERWLTLKLDAKEDICPYLEQLLAEGNSAALISVLINVAKYQPALLKQELKPLLTFPDIFHWDERRIENIGYTFDDFVWFQQGEAIFNAAREWTLSPHRKLKFLEISINLLIENKGIADQFKSIVPTWNLPDDPKEALEYKLIFARLNRDHYQLSIDADTGGQTLAFICPDSLIQEMQQWQADHAEPLSQFMTPYQCQKRIERGGFLTDEEAGHLYNLIITCENETIDENNKEANSSCKIAASSTLVILGTDWLTRNQTVYSHILQILRTTISEIPSTARGIRQAQFGSLLDGENLLSYAIVQLWIKDCSSTEWERAILCLLTSGNYRSSAAIVDTAYLYRDQLGNAWWRLIQLGTLWSGLRLLIPRIEGDCDAERRWNRWLLRFRAFPLREKEILPSYISLERIAKSCSRLEYRRELRLYNSGHDTWYGEPEPRLGFALDSTFLEGLFHWLIKGDGTGDWVTDKSLALSIWNYDAQRAKERSDKDDGEYDLPSGHLGYDILHRLAVLTIEAPSNNDALVWRPLLERGPVAHVALKHFIRAFFLQLREAGRSSRFEMIWRAMVEYALEVDWSQKGLWFHGERLKCDLLGFGNASLLVALDSGAITRMKDLYEKWANTHLRRDENIGYFCHFLKSDFAAPLRSNGLRWLADTLKQIDAPKSWFRDETGEVIAELISEILTLDFQALATEPEARQAVIEIVAILSANNMSIALTLQDRIRQLR